MLLALALPFYAQESDDDEGIEVVITTATKTEKDILDTSQAVSALSGDEIVQLGLTSIKDLNNMVPGLYVQGAVGPAAVSYTHLTLPTKA